MKEGVRIMTVLSYAVVLFGIFILLMVEPGSDGLTKEHVVIFFLLAGIFLAIPNIFGWRSDTFYPFPNHRRKAVVLWLYGLPLAALIAALVYLEEFAWWTQVALFVLTFVHLTTMTFGVLPYYGGAYQEYVEIMKKRDRSSKLKPDEREYPACNDSTYVSFEEVCNTCLSAVVPEDNTCWRCGKTIRWRKRHIDRWVVDPKRGWRRSRSDFGTQWRRTWFPEYVFVLVEGQLEKYPVHSVVAVVEKREPWSGWSSWSIYGILHTNGANLSEKILLEFGMEMTPREAKEKVEHVLPNIDFKKLTDGD